jgi:hypothetical protein
MAERTLAELKKEYGEIQKKYNLPSFRQLNEDFQIEKVCEYETETLIREVRRFMADKMVNYLRFVESVFHPMNASVFILSVVKTIGISEKKKLEEVYKKLAENEVKLLEVDLDFSEEKEARFIKEAYEIWQSVKKDLIEVMENVRKNWGNKFEPNNKGYFG